MERGKEGGTLQPQGRLHRGLPSPGRGLQGGSPRRFPRFLCTHRWVPGRRRSIRAGLGRAELPARAAPPGTVRRV